MKIKATLLSLTMMILMVSSSVFAQKQQPNGTPGTAVPGQLIVKFEKSVDIDAFTANYKVIDGFKSGLQQVEQLSKLSNIYLLSFCQQGTNVDKIIDALSNNDEVQAVQLNHYIEERATTPNDSQFGAQWHHIQSEDHDIDSDEAWDISTGGYTANGDRIVVCILEGGGSDYNHVDLIDNHWVNEGEIAGNGIDDDGNGYIDDVNGWNASSNNDAISTGSHGTALSGMIGATGNNGIGVAGVNWSVGLMQVQMGGLSESNVIAAYSYPHTMRNMYNTSNGTQGAFVVATNASWGIDQADPAQYPVWCAYYDDLGSVGILNCGATANAQFDIDAVGDMPTGCSSDYMVSVTATNNQDVRTFSAYGATTIDLGAPGENVMMTAAGNSYGTSSGTSFASPCVAGAIALIYSAPCSDLATNALTSPQATADLVKGFIMSGVDPIDQLTNETVSGGRLNVFNSIGLAMTNCNPDLGCMDETACNYSPEAIEDNGNCQYFDLCGVCGGNDSSCTGCTDAAACNYDADNTIDDNSCIYGNGVNMTVGGGTWDGEIGWSIILDGSSVANGGAGSADLCIGDGCYTLTMTDTYGDGWNGASYTLTDVATGTVIMTGDLDTAVNTDGTSAGEDYFSINSTECGLGCTDPAACNYDENAAVDNGSCNFDCSGCMDTTACNYDETATIDDGSCLQNDECGECGGDSNSCSGCMDTNACNYDETATIEDDSCIMPDPDFGCDCESFVNVSTGELVGEASSEAVETTGNGTLTSVAVELDWTNTTGDGSWVADMLVSITGPDGSCLEFGGFNVVGSCTSVGNYEVVYPIEWTSIVSGIYNATVDVSAANLSGDGVWSVSITNGWATSGGASYNASFTLAGVCPGDFVEVLGCTDSAACNYNVDANTNDDSCDYTSCAGCMDAEACNYDELATIDDGSCDFTSCDCPADVNGDGVISVADILVLLGEFGCSSGCSVDLNGDDATNVQDILLLLAAFGSTC